MSEHSQAISTEPPDPPLTDSPVLATVARFAVPLTVFVSAVIFFQGHNQPGGGFIAGVLAAAAAAMGMLAFSPTCPAKFAWWKPLVIALLILPVTKSPSAAGITLVVGLAIRIWVGGRAIRDIPWWTLAVLGFAVSIMTGFVPLAAGHEFMNHTVWHFAVLGWEDHLPTATFFDVGVYLIVFGTLTTIFVELGQEGGD